MYRLACSLLARLFLATMAILPGLPIAAQQITKIEYVTFETNVVPNTAAASPVRLRALLYTPSDARQPMPAVVITPSSGGVRDEIEIHYASDLARAGIAALVIDSFGARGLSHSVHDQSVLTSWQTANDAVAGLRWLAADSRFQRDRIGVMGVSKGGIVAMNAALTLYLQWTRTVDVKFAAHIAIAPFCSWVPRSVATTGAPILFMLAELDDQCPAVDCVDYAEALRRAGAVIETRVYRGAHHAWEFLGSAPHFDKWAENYSRCRVWIEDDGSETAVNDGMRIPRDGAHEWAKKNCMTLGALCCGGNAALKRQATDDAIAFLRKNGF